MVSLIRKNPMRDFNEPMICGYLDDLGIPYWHLSGSGIPDLLVLHKGLWKLLEVKSEKGTLTGVQKAFFTAARQDNAQHLFVVRDLDDLLLALES